ncbi:hypothetical protein KC318_g5492 [Hortaea werneckii]|uniref:Uncharacterized protein n=1 Tax=Hortaea werneckii TaxID=91943 RepID=A0A3M6ZYL5_HORWE|nr:hypothetical protein KC334_g9462 [Hortaea werneckii]KAI7011956.1 hypothetical protein KC355_g5598 [Hortaea werneckii]KAI7668060.1 hypothetical protein KC318_g5492 [Hortaea werneckii]RMX92545.1 hypothetical protein D0867_14547 [Hortaea werneckii]RMY20303.1 hypothetical protein D0866_12577 [Hortaea werneckii]
MGETPPRRESGRADDRPHRVSALLRAAERDSSDSSLSDDGLADLDNFASIEEVQTPTSSSLPAAKYIEKSKGKEPLSYARASNASIQRKSAPTHPQLGIEVTSVAGSPDRHSSLKARGTYHCLTTNGTTGQGRQAQANNDSLPRSRSNSEGRQSQAPLTILRKRIRSSKLEHKIVKHERSQRLFPSKEKPSIGDGFEKSELHVEYRIVSHRRRKPWRRDAIVYKQLPMAGGRLPDVMFECSADELNVEQSGGPHHITAHLPSSSTQGGPSEQPTASAQQAQSSLREETQANFNDGNYANLSLRTFRQIEKSAAGSSHLSKRCVSFSERDRFIDAQLSSIKAPPRPRGDPDDDEDAEDSADDDEEVESETSKDEEEVVLQTVDAANRIDDELLVDYVDNLSTRQELTPSEQPAHRFKNSHMGREDPVDSSDDEELEGAIEAPRSLRRRSIESMRLMEADEPIDDFADRGLAARMSGAMSSHYSGSTEGRMSRKTLRKSAILEERTDCMVGQPRRPRLRSILKSNTPLVPEVTYRPDDLEGNARRNSRHAVNVEDSRYFSQASEILRNPDISNHKILPRRTRSKHFSGEDEEQVEGYHDGQLHGSRQDPEFVGNPQNSPNPERDLKSLTRQVSRANGTMSQSVRRRSTLGFESPFKIPPIR